MQRIISRVAVSFSALGMVLGFAAAANAQQGTGQAPQSDSGQTEAQSRADVAPARPAREQTVFDGDFLSIGAGAVYAPSYTGSDDYSIFPIPAVQGRLGGVDINMRAGGIALDFIPDPEDAIGFDAGISVGVRRNRVSGIKDEVVKRLDKLDMAVEVGPTVGVTIPGVLHQYDRMTVTTDVLFDVAGAHSGMVVQPSVSYFTPLSRSFALALGVSGQYADGDFIDYNFGVTPEQSLQSGGVLPVFETDGGGFTRASATTALFYDLDGDLANGGWALFGLANYSRMFGDAADTPYTSIRGDRNQFIGALGVGYTF